MLEDFEEICLEKRLVMSIKKIKENVYQEFKMDKYELFVTAINEIGDFPNILIGFYLDNTAYDSSDFLGFKINSGWNDDDETATYISKFRWGEAGGEDKEIRVYYTYEEFLHYFLTYYLENINCYGNMINIIEQEFVNFTKHTDYAKEYEINLDVMNIFERDNLRNFLLEYNKEENKYLHGFINYYNKTINYWDINILKKFMSYLLGKNILKDFLKGKRKFKINIANYFEDRGYYEGYNIKIDKNNILIDYYTINNYLGREEFGGQLGVYYRDYVPELRYIGNITKEETDTFIKERYKGTREKMNVEVIAKEEFIKELEIIVNAYVEIYKDKEAYIDFENFKKELGCDNLKEKIFKNRK